MTVADNHMAVAALERAQKSFDSLQAGATIAQQPWSEHIVQFLSLSVLGFTVVALVMVTLLLWRSKSSEAQVLKIFGVLSILGLSALLLVAGYSNEQLTPIVGLFGAVAGYLLGKEPKANSGE